MNTKATGYPICNNFTYHPPFGDQVERYQQIRDAGFELAQHVLGKTPTSREQSVALTKIEEAVMWANAAIARNESPSNECEKSKEE